MWGDVDLVLCQEAKWGIYLWIYLFAVHLIYLEASKTFNLINLEPIVAVLQIMEYALLNLNFYLLSVCVNSAINYLLPSQVQCPSYLLIFWHDR